MFYEYEYDENDPPPEKEKVEQSWTLSWSGLVSAVKKTVSLSNSVGASKGNSGEW
jgi:hypothetical protein